MSQTISVIVPMRDAGRTIAQCLDSVLDALARVGGGEIVVVDNGSRDGSRETVRARGPAVTLLEYPGHTIAGLRNVGVRSTSGSCLSFVDADCVVAPGYYQAALRILDETSAVVAGSWYTLPDSAGWLERAWDGINAAHREGATRLIPGGNLVVRREVFDLLGGFREAMVTGEDAEFCLRALRNEVEVHQTPALQVVHLGNPRTLAGFFRQQVWHGRGMLGAATLDRPLQAVMLHLAMCAAAIAVAFTSLQPPGLRWGTVVLLTLTAPALAVAYRLRRGGDPRYAFPGLLLYWLYLGARIVAIPAAILDVLRPRMNRLKNSRTGSAT